MPIDVLLVDDHAALREGFKMMLESTGSFRVVGQAGNHREAVEALTSTDAELVVIDISLPGLDGIETTVDILRIRPAAKVAMLTMHDDQAHVVAALRAGASGYLLKSDQPREVIEGLLQICHGANYFSPRIAGWILERIQNETDDRASSGKLTRRELQVLRLVGEGRTNKEVAAALDLETETVRAYRKTLMKKLAVRNAAELTRIAMSMGLVMAAKPAGGATAGCYQQGAW